MPTAEESAYYLLDIFVDKFNRRPGEVLGRNNLETPFNTGKWRGRDFKPGLEFSVEQDWIEIVTQDAFRLTEAGFNAAQSRDDL